MIRSANRNRSRRRWLVAVAAVSAFAVWAGNAYAVSGAAYTTTNRSFDTGPGICLNGNPKVNCNIYSGKQYVWLNGGPDANGNCSRTASTSSPCWCRRGSNNPNDGSSSEPFGRLRHLPEPDVHGGQRRGHLRMPARTSSTPTRRTTTRKRFGLYPYANTTNPGGVYILAICHLGPNGTTYPVDPRDCKYDAFKVPLDDRTPPVCPDPILGTNAERSEDRYTRISPTPAGSTRSKSSTIINATWYVVRTSSKALPTR